MAVVLLLLLVVSVLLPCGLGELRGGDDTWIMLEVELLELGRWGRAGFTDTL